MDEVKSDQIILALDVDTAEEALSWAKRFRGKIGTFKVGLQL
jgi:orotidine-5'-phosphate decarboxylase